jgi:hypothetical protein
MSAEPGTRRDASGGRHGRRLTTRERHDWNDRWTLEPLRSAVLVLAANGLLAALRDGTPAAHDVARFPADGKNRNGVAVSSGLPDGAVISFR